MSLIKKHRAQDILLLIAPHVMSWWSKKAFVVCGFAGQSSTWQPSTARLSSFVIVQPALKHGRQIVYACRNLRDNARGIFSARILNHVKRLPRFTVPYEIQRGFFAD